MAEPRVLVWGDQVSFAFGSRQVFSNASWVVRENERVALVAPNGAGKTTLIKLLLGKLQPDLGEVKVDPSLKYGYLTQQFEFPPETTVGQLVTELPPQAKAVKEQMEAIEALMADPKFYEEPGYEDVLTKYGEMQREFQLMASKGDENAALSFLQELGLPEVTLETRMRTLSGGQKTRVLLAKALANYQDMDLLILDEPTNHLDIETVEWLEEFLVERYGGALLLVAHDQYLMDNLATKVLEIDEKKVWEWEGNYSAYVEQKEATLRALEARRRREMDEFKRQLQIIEEIKRRNRFDHQAQSKQTRLEKMKKDAHAAAGPTRSRGETFKLVLKSVQKSSNDVLYADRLTKRFGDDVILDDASFSLGKGDKVGLIGPNGCGKTTLLRMVVGLERPTSGTLEVSPGVKIGFFDQEHAGLDPSRTLIEEVKSIRRMDEAEARGLLGRFLFKGEDAFKKVDKLSGGEKARMALLKFLVGETNLLVLDEPTNHLDLASQKVVEEALARYDGTLLVVSHDRHFLDAVVNKIAVVANRKVGIFPGNFSQTRTLTRLQEFMGTGEPVPHVVRRSFKDYETGKRYSTGETVLVTGGETQTTKRLFRLALERGWMEPK
ncbi:MAG TPA: ABC-F family ATP-binding cassette domain-containing protein [Candidatus Thermoplasmatota archaeon]|nr:ABC-F family ATP-binding cassette domain-containing protein [Candidatus Thermoplasmatota archaeon]